jgi:hypothetical protein
MTQTPDCTGRDRMLRAGNQARTTPAPGGTRNRGQRHSDGRAAVVMMVVPGAAIRGCPAARAGLPEGGRGRRLVERCGGAEAAGTGTHRPVGGEHHDAYSGLDGGVQHLCAVGSGGQ